MTEKHGSPNGFPPAHQERLEQGREAGNPFFKKDSPSSSSSSENTLIVGVGTLISRLLGFVRDAGIAWLLGGSGAADALTAALRIPYMARRLFGEGTLSLSLTAACTRERLRGGSGCGLALAVTRKLALWTGFLALACMAGAGIIMRAIAPGLEERPEVFGEAVTLFRICAPYIWSVMMAAGCMAALHSRQRFLLPSLTPSLFNLCVIGFALLAAFNPSLQPGVLVACGVLCGGILQWLAQVPATRILQREEGKRGKPADARTVSEAFRRLPAGIVGAAMPQLAFLGASALASLLPEGHMASLFYAERLLEFPLGVLGAAVGMAAAPRLAELAASEGLSRSSRFHEIPSFSLSQPQKPEQADPPPPLSASRTARNDTKAIPGARLQKPWDGEGMEFEDGEPFFKRGEPPHGSLSPSPSSLPTAPPHSFSDEIQRAALLSLGLNLPCGGRAAWRYPRCWSPLCCGDGPLMRCFRHGACPVRLRAPVAPPMCASALCWRRHTPGKRVRLKAAACCFWPSPLQGVTPSPCVSGHGGRRSASPWGSGAMRPCSGSDSPAGFAFPGLPSPCSLPERP